MNFDDPSVIHQAASAGFDSVELYVQNLIEQDAERLAIQQGLDDVAAGRVRPFEEFDREFRAKNGLPPRAP